jgi:hypothetical protein
MTIYPVLEKPPLSPKPARRKRVTRTVPEDLPPLRVTERDLAMVYGLYTYRALDSNQLQRLYFPVQRENHHSRTVHCRDRLAKLFHHGYVWRDERGVKISDARKPLVYFLDKKGAELLIQYAGIDVDTFDWHPRDSLRGASDLFLDHLLQINEVRIALTMAAPLAHAELVRWVDDKTLRSRHWKDYVTLTHEQGTTQKVAIVPDGYGQLSSRDQSGAQIFDYFALEVDMATSTGWATDSQQRSWGRKVKAYLAYHSSGLYQARYATQSLRILTVTTGERRLAHLMAWTERAGGKARFWFTTLEDIQQQNILTDPIWRVAGRGEQRHCFLW